MSLELKIRVFSIIVAFAITALIMYRLVFPASQAICEVIYVEACSYDQPIEFCRGRLLEAEVCR